MINLLVIDDDPEWLAILSGYFVTKGIRVFRAKSFAEGMRQSERKKVDLLLTDFKLGDGEGTEILKHFRQVHPESRLIMISGFEDPHLEEKAKQCGAEVFLKKPVDLELLTNWVIRLTDQG